MSPDRPTVPGLDHRHCIVSSVADHLPAIIPDHAMPIANANRWVRFLSYNIGESGSCLRLLWHRLLRIPPYMILGHTIVFGSFHLSRACHWFTIIRSTSSIPNGGSGSGSGRRFLITPSISDVVCQFLVGFGGVISFRVWLNIMLNWMFWLGLAMAVTIVFGFRVLSEVGMNSFGENIILKLTMPTSHYVIISSACA